MADNNRRQDKSHVGETKNYGTRILPAILSDKYY